MKKYLLGILAVFVLILTGCTQKTKEMKCERTLTQGDLKLTAEYNVTYTGKYVDSVKSIESIKYTGTDSTVLDTYKLTVENMYNEYTDIKGFNNKVEIEDDTLISTTNIDYKKIDVNKLIEIDSANKLIIKNNKIAFEDLKNVYTSNGIICED